MIRTESALPVAVASFELDHVVKVTSFEEQIVRERDGKGQQ